MEVARVMDTPGVVVNAVVEVKAAARMVSVNFMSVRDE